MDYKAESLRLHFSKKGKIEVQSKIPVLTKDDLSIVYNPGVLEASRRIMADNSTVYKYTMKSHTVAVVTDGTAVLGLGDIGPEASIPVMEGKALLFKELGEVDAFPICLDTKDPDEIVKTIKFIAPTFGGINLEDISSPRCFEIEEKLIRELDIPVLHTDQHATAITVTAAIINSLRIVKKDWADLKIVVVGAGAAGLSTCRLLMNFGPKDIILVNRRGIIYEGRPDLNPIVSKMARITNKNKLKGNLTDAIKGADIFIGLSASKVLTTKMVKTMADDAIVFALANPDPEIMPEEAFAGGARIVATGRPEFPNHINNHLAFPGLFRGALMVRATSIVEDMKVGAARALASLVSNRELNEKFIIPDVFDKRCARVIADEVASVAEQLGLAKNPGNREW
ncbi:MAG: NADP-dependent malic enzyme [Bacilli bacterium]|nr:NADP-dependent malic enzyme [Bacilli bacterium]